MNLTPEQQALLDGAKGPAMAKVVKTLVMYGECFGATRMVPVTSRNGHIVTSFGLSMLGPVYDLMDELIEQGALSGQAFSRRPAPARPRQCPPTPCSGSSSRSCTQSKMTTRHNCARWGF